MSTLLDETRDHAGDTPFFGDSNEDSFQIDVPDGEQFDSVVLKIQEQTNGGANITVAPQPGQTGGHQIRVHYWYNGGPTRGRVKYQIQAFSIPLAPGMATRFLDYRAAAAAGARFLHNIDPGSGPYAQLGVGDWLDGQWDPGEWIDGKRPGVLFVANPGVWFAVHGIKATPEAYKGFTLKNGWRIKSINVSHWRLGKTQFRWKEKPEIGSDNPYMQVLVSADPLGSFTKEGVSVLIEGPRGRDPYFD